VIDLFELGPYAHFRASAGAREWAEARACQAFLHRPTLVVLDEPVNSLDPAGVVEVRTLPLNLARDQGVRVLLSSHRHAAAASVPSA